MNFLEDKTYLIVLAADPSIWVGANDIIGSDVQQVVTDGKMKSWGYREGCYVLNVNWTCFVEGFDVKVDRKAIDCVKLHIVETRPGVYRIEIRGTNLAWTTGLGPKKPVTIAPVGSVEAKYQEFKFILE